MGDWRDTPVEEHLMAALADDANTGLDEDEIAACVEAVIPVLKTFGQTRYDEGLRAGDWFARRHIAHRLGLGDLETPPDAAHAAHDERREQ